MSNWKHPKALLAERLPAAYESLNSGAGSALLREVSEYFGVKLPPTLVELLSEVNGQKPASEGLLFGFHLLPLQDVLREAREWAAIDNDDFDADDFSSWPEGAIRLQYTNPRWLPLLHDGSGNFVGLDFDPGLKGTSGQVINFGRDEEAKFVLASCFDEFLGHCVQITHDPAVMGGRPCIRGLRVTVGTILGLLAAGQTEAQILAAYPYLELGDVQAALSYAAWRTQETELPLP
jgi:cell wall assembly regulator SMI1